MNILHIGICVYGRVEGIEKAFMSIADNYYARRPKEVSNSLKSHDVDIVFMQLQEDPYPEVLKDVLRHHRERGAKVVLWNGDIRHNPPKSSIDLADYVDILAFSNDRDIDYFVSKGYNAKFLQIGIDPDIFNPDGEKDPNAGRIVFLANHAPHFSNVNARIAAVRELKRVFGNDFKLYGNGWPDNLADGECNVKNPMQDVATWQKKEAAIYRGCEVAICISSFNVSGYTSDRLFRASACGAAVAVEYFPRVNDVLPGVICFNGITELVEKIKNGEFSPYNGWDVIENYSYNRMVNKILEL